MMIIIIIKLIVMIIINNIDNKNFKYSTKNLNISGNTNH